MGFNFEFKARDQIAKYAWAIVISVLREMGEVAMEELAKGLEEFRKQGKTPDGWTREEYLTYAIGRLRIVQSRSIGPWVIDEILDWCIERLIDVLEGKLEHLDAPDGPTDVPNPPVEPPAEQPPVTPPPAPTPTPDPPAPVLDSVYYPRKYGPWEVLPMDLLKRGDLVYKTSTHRFAIPAFWAGTPQQREVTKDATLIIVVGED